VSKAVRYLAENVELAVDVDVNHGLLVEGVT